MDEKIRAMYQNAPRFDEGQLYQSEEYRIASRKRERIKRSLYEWYGRRAAEMLEEYDETMDQITEQECIHYFQQGVLAASGTGK